MKIKRILRENIMKYYVEATIYINKFLKIYTEQGKAEQPNTEEEAGTSGGEYRTKTQRGYMTSYVNKQRTTRRSNEHFQQ